ncbi:hypothetical protein AAHC03_09691 [Spirometra sp. Aus1]
MIGLPDGCIEDEWEEADSVKASERWIWEVLVKGPAPEGATRLKQESQTREGRSRPRQATGMRLPEQFAQTPQPHARQWWIAARGPKTTWQRGQLMQASSGCQ